VTTGLVLLKLLTVHISSTNLQATFNLFDQQLLIGAFVLSWHSVLLRRSLARKQPGNLPWYLAEFVEVSNMSGLALLNNFR
jgi:hypothetical protein